MEEKWLREVLADAKKAQERHRVGSSSASGSAPSPSPPLSNPSSLGSRSRATASGSSSAIAGSVHNTPPDTRQAIRRQQNAEVSHSAAHCMPSKIDN